MNTQALLTDLTPEQEENVNGGIWFLVTPVVIVGLTLLWQSRRR
jgi:hypothetical protein